jgi:hypothetical protein
MRNTSFAAVLDVLVLYSVPVDLANSSKLCATLHRAAANSSDHLRIRPYTCHGAEIHASPPGKLCIWLSPNPIYKFFCMMQRPEKSKHLVTATFPFTSFQNILLE